MEPAAFIAEGLAVLAGVFAGTDLQALHAAAERLRSRARRDGLATRHWGSGPPARTAWGLDFLERGELLDPALLGVIGAAPVDAALRRIFGHQPAVRFSTLLWAPQDADYDLHWHRDLLPLDLYDAVAVKPAAQDHVRFYVALCDDDALRYVPRSHRRVLVGRERELAESRARGPYEAERVLALQAGDVALFDPHLLHHAWVAAGADRLTLLISVQAAWIPLAPLPIPGLDDWIASAAFLERLDPTTRRYYAARRGVPAGHPFAYLEEALR